MAKDNDTPMERLKKQPLWFWGFVCIFSGVFSNLLFMMMLDGQSMPRAERRAVQFGSGVACMLFIIIGIVLIVMYFIRKKKS
ncbi:MAG: hypothetical protein HKN47_02370 [Pirellulaceae bacterium]|nr:hypothetical protein [Pirellulaceae bacterium]